MADKITLEIVGAKELSKKFGKMHPRVWRKPMRKAMSAEMKDVRSKMREKVPQDTKDLRKSIQTNSWFIERQGGALDIFVRTGPTFRGYGRKRGWKAHFLELGTSRTDAQPFVQPVFSSVKASLPAKFTAALRAILGL